MSNDYIQSSVESTDLYNITARYTGECHWYLLPFHSQENRKYFSNCYYGFNHIYRKLIIDRGKIYMDPSGAIIKMLPVRAAYLERMIYANQTFRWKMKRLIHKWRLGRIKQANTDDILTGEPPVKPIYIYDWAQRTKYVFEAGTVYRDMCTRLFNADSLFINTLPPRNMFTNTPYTLGQLHFIIKDLRKYGYAHWAIQGLQACGYGLKHFGRVYKQSIHLEVLKRCFSKPEDCAPLVLDFIEMEYEYHDKNCILSDVLSWYIQTHPSCPLIEAWRKLCFKYYKHSYMNSDNSFDDIIHILSGALMKMSITFMYEKYSEANLLAIVTYYENIDDDL